MDDSEIIMILLVIIIMLVIIGLFFVFTQRPADNTSVADNNQTTVEKVSSEDKVEQVSSSQEEALPYDINNLPPSNDPYPETKRYQIDQYHVRQEYSDGYHSFVDLRTGERHGSFGN